MKARILKGGWSWLGNPMIVGSIIDAPSAQWIANRVADNELVEPVADNDPESVEIVAPPAAPAAAPEITSVPSVETATTPSPRASAKKKGMTDA